MLLGDLLLLHPFGLAFHALAERHRARVVGVGDRRLRSLQLRGLVQRTGAAIAAPRVLDSLIANSFPVQIKQVFRLNRIEDPVSVHLQGVGHLGHMRVLGLEDVAQEIVLIRPFLGLAPSRDSHSLQVAQLTRGQNDVAVGVVGALACRLLQLNLVALRPF